MDCYKRCIRNNFDNRTSALFQLAVREFPGLSPSNKEAILGPYGVKANTIREAMKSLCKCQCGLDLGKDTCPSMKSPAADLARKLSSKPLQSILRGNVAMRYLAKEVGNPGRLSEIQSIAFDLEKWTEAKARKWLKDHGFKAPRADIIGKHLKFRQEDPDKYERIRWATKEKQPFLKKYPGVFAVYGFTGEYP